MDQLLDKVQVKVTGAMNDLLLKSFSSDEVKTALFPMFPTKALESGGYPAHFFQRHWDIWGEVSAVVLRVLRGEDDPALINKTSIILILKVEKPEELGQFRPISLCNVIYKIASKTVANRLHAILPEVIFRGPICFCTWLLDYR